MSGHQSTVASILSHGADPQVITGSHDNTIRTWDVRTGKTMQVLTYHKKSVRALAMSPNEVRRWIALFEFMETCSLPFVPMVVVIRHGHEKLDLPFSSS
jgi:WD40 repeat protein